MNLERVVWTQIRFLFMAIWARFWVVHSGWRRRCVRWSGFLGLRGLGLSIFVGLLSVRGNKSNMLSFQLINCGRKLGFPRDVPGQSGTGRPVVPFPCPTHSDFQTLRHPWVVVGKPVRTVDLIQFELILSDLNEIHNQSDSFWSKLIQVYPIWTRHFVRPCRLQVNDALAPLALLRFNAI